VSVENMSTDGGLTSIVSVGIEAGAESEGMTVIESCRTRELMASNCESSFVSSDLLNNFENLTVRRVSMNSVS
jgi:hypothetical protein